MTILKSYSLAALAAGSVSERLVATAAERTEIAERFGFLDVPALSADVTLTARGQGALLKARIRGEIVQQCGITLEEVPESIDIDLSVNFLPESEYDEEMHAADSEAEIEVFEGDSLDIGETLTQLFAMAANPYPRHPDADISKIVLPEGAKLRDGPEGPDEKSRQSPFAVLSGLRKNT